MTRAAAVAVALSWWLVAAPTATAQDLAAHAFVEVDVARAAGFVGEPIGVVLRFGVDRTFLADHVVQPFRQRLDVPVRVEAEWLEELDRVRWRQPATEPRGATFVLNDELCRGTPVADRDVAGVPFAVFEIGREFVPLEPGAVTIPAPRLRISYATRFRDDFLNGRVPEDQVEGVVVGDDVALRIDALPVAGRPAGFAGAVGRFSVSAVAAVAAVDLGQSFRLTLRITGDGDLAAFEPPRLDDLDGFHVLGRIDDVGADGRVVHYELIPLREDLTAVPQVAFAFFDPGPPAGYRSVRTESVPLEVRPSAAGARMVERLAPDAVAAADRDAGLADLLPVDAGAPVDIGNPPSTDVVLLALLAPWGVALVVWQLIRARTARRVDPELARARNALGVFRDALTGGRRDAGELLAEFVAARLRCPPAAVIGPQLEARMRVAGVSGTLSARTAELLARLVGRRYGGERVDGGDAELLELVRQLDLEFRGAEVAA